MASTYGGGKPRDQKNKDGSRKGFRERSNNSDGDSDSEDPDFAFRALRSDEVKIILAGGGIVAKDPAADLPTKKVISHGSRMDSQYIPLTRSKKVAAAWSSLPPPEGSGHFVKIDLDKLERADFTGAAGDGLDGRVRNMARSSQEVHVKGAIPFRNIIGLFRATIVPSHYSFDLLKTDKKLSERRESFVRTKARATDPHVNIRITPGFDEPPPLPARCLIHFATASDLKLSDADTKRDGELGELGSAPKATIPELDSLEVVDRAVRGERPPGPAFTLSSPVSSPDQYDSSGRLRYVPKGLTASYQAPLPEIPVLPAYLPKGLPATGAYSPFPSSNVYTAGRSLHPSPSLQSLSSASPTISPPDPSSVQSSAKKPPSAKKTS